MQHPTFQTRFQSHMLNRHFGAMPSLHDLPEPQVRMVRALRITALLGKGHKCPVPHIMPMLGGIAAATQFIKVVQVLGAHWPETIRIYRPCCPLCSPDEVLLLNMVDCIVRRDLSAFRTLLSDMVSEQAIIAIQSEIVDFVARHIRPRHGI
jgi:hypothetical protein